MTTWADHLYSLQALGMVDSSDLGSVFHRLVTKQHNQWPELQRGMAAWASARRRSISLDEGSGCYVELLCNPVRYANVTVVPDKTTVCPLCLEYLPSEEMGVSVGSSLVVLPNPAPIIRDHVVISHRDHNRQSLTPHFEEILTVLAESKGDVAILYNGPSSGASTPHHLHFQAGSSTELPLLRHAFTLGSLLTLRNNGCSVRAMDGEGRRFLLLVSRDVGILTRTLLGIVDSNEGEQEIDLNLVMWKQEHDLSVALFPRGAHRPSCFYRSEPDRILVSPGSMEMAGLVVVPRFEDWARLTAADMRTIYREVCIGEAAWDALLSTLERRFE